MKDYIAFIVICIGRFFTRFMYIFPVKNDRVLFSSFNGAGYSCNPKYICEYMMQESEKKWDIIWAIKKNISKDEFPENVKICTYHGLKYFYYLATAKIAIDNVGFISIYPRRKNQLFINTWHGGGCYKNVGCAEKRISPIVKKREVMAAHNINLYLSSSAFFSDEVIRKQFDYNGDILEKGMPRNDLLVNEKLIDIQKCNEKVRNYYKIDRTKRIALYAPTWRYSKTIDIYNLDTKLLKTTLETKFGGEWLILCRMHHYVDGNNLQDGVEVISANDYPDMQELLMAADVLISDYSSSIWDYSFSYKPCFLLALDLKEYIQERGFVRDIYTWGFPVCENNMELKQAILQYDREKNINRMNQHHKDLDSYEKGIACHEVMQYINEFCGER